MVFGEIGYALGTFAGLVVLIVFTVVTDTVLVLDGLAPPIGEGFALWVAGCHIGPLIPSLEKNALIAELICPVIEKTGAPCEVNICDEELA